MPDPNPNKGLLRLDVKVNRWADPEMIEELRRFARGKAIDE